MPRTPDGKEKLLPGSRPASPSPGPEPAGATSAAGSGWSGAAEPAAADADAGGAAGLLQRVRGVLRQLSHEISREDGDSDEDEGGGAEGSSFAAAALRESRSAFAAGGGASPHPNFPMVRPDVGEVDVVPVVSETRGRPTPRDVWKYSTCACVAACTICVCVPVLVIVALVVVYEEQGQAGLEEAVGASPCSSLPLVRQLTEPECNSCKHGGDRAYNGECDENGACSVGTDRFDCLVQVASRQALYQASDATATIESFDGPVVSRSGATRPRNARSRPCASSASPRKMARRRPPPRSRSPASRASAATTGRRSSRRSRAFPSTARRRRCARWRRGCYLRRSRRSRVR